jgi:hypothetical protein
MTAGIDLTAIAYAVTASVLFAVANNFQRVAASAVPLEAGGPVRLVFRLLRAPGWQFGSLLALVALGLHAVALARGGVTLVQAILASSLIVALGIEAVRGRRRMRAVEVGGSVALVAGVVMLVSFGRPGAGRAIDVTVQVLAGLVLAGVAGLGMAASRMRTGGHAPAVVMGAAAGSCFAVDALFLKGVADSVGDLDALPAVVDLAGFVLASMIGNLVVQRAYQRAPLRLVLPAVTAADPLTAFIVGRWLLGEHLQTGVGSGLAVGMGLSAMAVGIVMTTTGSITGADQRPAER